MLKCDIRQFFASVDHQKLKELLAQRVNNQQALELLGTVIDSFEQTPGKGIPLGNVTSQLFANVYLHELDWFVKQQLKERYYLRYCDDFAIVSTSRNHLLQVLPLIEGFLTKSLGMALHPRKVTITPYEQGIDFLGYVIKPHCTLLRPKTKRRMLARVDDANISSYIGLCSHADTYELQQLTRILAWQNSSQAS